MHTGWRWRYSVGARPLPLKVAPIQRSVTTDFHLQSRRDSDCQMSEFVLDFLVFEKQSVNSLAPGRCGSNLWIIMFKVIISNTGLDTCSEIAVGWMSQNLSNEVQVMAWCCQAANHYRSQLSPRSTSLYAVTRPQWVNLRWQSDTTGRQRSRLPLFQVMACLLFGAKPLPEPMLTWELDP